MRDRASFYLIASAIFAAIVGFTVAAGSLLVRDPDAANALLLGGVVTTAAGVHGVLAWIGFGSRAKKDAAADWTAEADACLSAGRFEHARTFYEEALRAGADPEKVVPRLIMAEARTGDRA